MHRSSDLTRYHRVCVSTVTRLLDLGHAPLERMQIAIQKAAMMQTKMPTSARAMFPRIDKVKQSVAHARCPSVAQISLGAIVFISRGSSIRI